MIDHNIVSLFASNNFLRALQVDAKRGGLSIVGKLLKM